jgi:hypothetical protein
MSWDVTWMEICYRWRLTSGMALKVPGSRFELLRIILLLAGSDISWTLNIPTAVIWVSLFHPVMCKLWVKTTSKFLPTQHLITAVRFLLPSNLTVQHHVCVADMKVVCAFLAVVQKWKLAIMARACSAQTLLHACVRVEASVLRSTDMGKALSLTSPVLSL